MNTEEKYEEFRRYFEASEQREQQYIVKITKQAIRINELEKQLEKSKYCFLGGEGRR